MSNFILYNENTVHSFPIYSAFSLEFLDYRIISLFKWFAFTINRLKRQMQKFSRSFLFSFLDSTFILYTLLAHQISLL